jgi:hypothetical protein
MCRSGARPRTIESMFVYKRNQEYETGQWLVGLTAQNTPPFNLTCHADEPVRQYRPPHGIPSPGIRERPRGTRLQRHVSSRTPRRLFEVPAKSQTASNFI